MACGGRKLLIAATPEVATSPFQVLDEGKDYKIKVVGAFRATDGKFIVLQSHNSKAVGKERTYREFICLDLCDGDYQNHVGYATERSQFDHFCNSVDQEL